MNLENLHSVQGQVSAQLQAQPWGHRVHCGRDSRTSRIGAQVGLRALRDGVETASAE